MPTQESVALMGLYSKIGIRVPAVPSTEVPTGGTVQEAKVVPSFLEWGAGAVSLVGRIIESPTKPEYQQLIAPAFMVGGVTVSGGARVSELLTLARDYRIPVAIGGAAVTYESAKSYYSDIHDVSKTEFGNIVTVTPATPVISAHELWEDVLPTRAPPAIITPEYRDVFQLPEYRLPGAGRTKLMKVSRIYYSGGEISQFPSAELPSISPTKPEQPIIDQALSGAKYFEGKGFGGRTQEMWEDAQPMGLPGAGFEGLVKVGSTMQMVRPRAPSQRLIYRPESEVFTPETWKGPSLVFLISEREDALAGGGVGFGLEYINANIRRLQAEEAARRRLRIEQIRGIKSVRTVIPQWWAEPAWFEQMTSLRSQQQALAVETSQIPKQYRFITPAFALQQELVAGSQSLQTTSAIQTLSQRMSIGQMLQQEPQQISRVLSAQDTLFGQLPALASISALASASQLAQTTKQSQTQRQEQMQRLEQREMFARSLMFGEPVEHPREKERYGEKYETRTDIRTRSGFFSGDDDDRKRRKQSQYQWFKEISPTATPRQVAGLESSRFQAFTKSITGAPRKTKRSRRMW